MRGTARKFPEANRDGFDAEQEIAGSRQGVPGKIFGNTDFDALMPPSSQGRQSVSCDCGNSCSVFSDGRRSRLAAPLLDGAFDALLAQVGLLQHLEN